MCKKLSKSEFINRCNTIHNNKFDYSLVDYKNLEQKIKIICPIHGIFEQQCKSHITGSGCKLCTYESYKLSQSEFIDKCKIVHGDKYDYSLVEYMNVRTKVKIVCPIHGIFEQTPASHLSEQCCPKCISKYVDTNIFIKKAKKIHGNKYDYSLVEYIDSKTNIKIICLKGHGIFEQTPNSHLNGYGCKYCNKNMLTTELFIEKANKIHGEYDYSLVKYKNITTKIKIICPIHGVFEQTPTSHLSGSKCPICSNASTKFIKKSTEKYNGKYNYSLVNYINNRTKVKIICPTHGIFEQKPNNHLYNGCPKCAGMNKSTEIFINECKNIHGDLYDYSLVKYVNSHTKIPIICKKHGIFEQLATNHLIGKGCPDCNKSKGELEIKKSLIKFNVNFIAQKKFDDCKDKKRLPFDFYLPDYNICVEFDGFLHYKPHPQFGGEAHFKYVKEHDEIKNKFCEEKNIQLIRLNDIKNIENFLKKELKING